MKKILVVGSSNFDLVIRSKKLPKPGETIIGDEFLINNGTPPLIFTTGSSEK